MAQVVYLQNQDIVRDCVSAAILAPSAHNTQPWRFRSLRNSLDLIADRTRALPANDPYDRELTISCGAALFNLRVAAAAKSWTATVDEFPFGDDMDLVARISFSSTKDGSIRDAALLADVLPLRRTYRRRFLDEPVTQEVIDSLVFAAEQERCFAAPLVGEAAREVAAQCISDADRIEWADPVWRREISSWMHPQRKNEGFGIPGLTQRAAQLVARTFDIGSGVAAHDSQILQGTPLLFVIGTPNDHDADWLHAGQALERVLLTACSHGLQASFLNQPLHIERLRSSIRAIAPTALTPQVLLRLGKPSDVLEPVTRRPLEAVLATDPLE